MRSPMPRESSKDECDLGGSSGLLLCSTVVVCSTNLFLASGDQHHPIGVPFRSGQVQSHAPPSLDVILWPPCTGAARRANSGR